MSHNYTEAIKVIQIGTAILQNLKSYLNLYIQEAKCRANCSEQSHWPERSSIDFTAV